MVGNPAFKFQLKIRQDIDRVMLAILERQAERVDTHATALRLYPVTGFAASYVQLSSLLLRWWMTGESLDLNTEDTIKDLAVRFRMNSIRLQEY